MLVCSGCYNKISQTGWLINNRNCVHSSGGWKFKIKIPCQWGSDQRPLRGGRLPTSVCVLIWRGEEARVSAVCSTKVLIPFTWALPSGPNHLPKDPPPNSSTSYHTAHALSTQEFRGTWSFRPVTACICRLFMTSWTAACQSPMAHGILHSDQSNTSC